MYYHGSQQREAIVKPNLYLSIDLDYFNGCEPEFVEVTLGRVLKGALSRRLPLLAVMNHQQILEHVNLHPADELWNFDQHSDVVPPNHDQLDCGSWATYVKWRQNASYVWVRNSYRTLDGSCNDRIWDKDLDWGQARSITGIEAPRWQDVLPQAVAVGICMSPRYINPELEAPLRAALARYGVPMRRGRREDDTISRRRRPPGVKRV